jgi:hypothetical protein
MIGVLMCSIVGHAQSTWLEIDSSEFTYDYQIIVLNGNEYYSATRTATNSVVIKRKDDYSATYSTVTNDATNSYGASAFKLINYQNALAIVFKDINGGLIVNKFNGTSFVQVGNFAFLPNVDYGFDVAVDPENQDIYLTSTSFGTGTTDVDVYKFTGLNWSQVVTAFNPPSSYLHKPQIHVVGTDVYLAFMQNEEFPVPLFVYKANKTNLSNATLAVHPVSGVLSEITSYKMKGEPNQLPFILSHNQNGNQEIRLSRLTATGSSDVSTLPLSSFYSPDFVMDVKGGAVSVMYTDEISPEVLSLFGKKWNGAAWESLADEPSVYSSSAWSLHMANAVNGNHTVAGYTRMNQGYDWGYTAISNHKPTLLSYQVAPICAIAGATNVSLFSSLRLQDLDFDKITISAVESTNNSVIAGSANLFISPVVSHDPSVSYRDFEIFASSIGSAGSTSLILIVTDGFEQISITISVTVFNPQIVSLPVTSFSACTNGDFVDLNELVLPFEGDFMYRAQLLPNGLFDPSNYSGSPNDVVRFIYTDGNGCATDYFISPELFYPSSIEVASTPSSCANSTGSAVLTIVEGSAPYEIYWSTGASDVYTLNDLASGAYFVNVLDANNCLSVAPAHIEASEISIQGTVTDVSCHGQATGSISLNITGADTPEMIIWSSGQSTSSISGLRAGVYDVWVKGESGCETFRSFTVNQPDKLATAFVTTTDPDCGASNGLLAPEIVGGITPYTYNWSTGASTSSLVGLPAGIYNLTVTDANSCTASFEYALNNQNAQSLTARVTQPSCGDQDGAIRVIPQSFWAVQSVVWSNSVLGFNNLDLSTGDFSCELTDWAGCKTFRKWKLGGKKPLRNEICLLTVDSATTTNLIVWEKVQNTGVDYYNIYRETSFAGQYMLIDTVQASNLSVFNDVVASPLHRSWRYRISAVDACGQEGPLSRQHKTIHLVTQQLSANEIKVYWDDYEGIEYGTLDLYRHTDEEGWQLLGSLPITQTSYLDTPTSLEGLDYMIEIVPDELCTAARAQDYNSSRSNKANGIFNPGEGTGDSNNSVVENSLLENVQIYPNPSNGLLYVSSESEDVINLSIFSTAGARVWEGEFFQTEMIDLSHVESGLYFVKLDVGGKTLTRKISIVR